MSKTVVSHTEQIRQECTDATFPVLQGRIGIKTGRAHIFSKICCDGRCEQYTSHVTFFSFTTCTCTDVSHDIGSSDCARHHPCVMRLGDRLFSLRSSLCIHRCLSHVPLHLPEPTLLPFVLFRVDVLGTSSPVHFAQMRSLALKPMMPLSHVTQGCQKKSLCVISLHLAFSLLVSHSMFCCLENVVRFWREMKQHDTSACMRLSCLAQDRLDLAESAKHSA